MNGFLKLRECNNWGSIYYCDPSGEKVNLKEGKPMLIMFNDGTMKIMDLVKRQTTNSYYEKGMRNSVSTHRYGVEVSIFGHNFFIPINELEVQYG